MTRRILQQIEISKIAAVDRPCQEGAVAAILKRAPTKEGTNNVELLLMSCSLRNESLEGNENGQSVS
jgi:hypothetical protein